MVAIARKLEASEQTMNLHSLHSKCMSIKCKDIDFQSLISGNMATQREISIGSIPNFTGSQQYYSIMTLLCNPHFLGLL